MQMTNGAIRSPNQDTLPSTIQTLEKEPSLDLDTFDLSAFVLPSSNTKGAGQKTNVQDKAAKEITQFIQESDDLFKMGQKYEIEVVARGHQSLYELLASIYGLALRIEQSEQSNKVVAGIRKYLKDNHQISIQTNSTPMAAIVRYVVRNDKVAASRYTKVLDVARKENLSPEELPAYVTRRGGVTQIQDTEANQLAKANGDKSNKERTEMIRELFKWIAVGSQESIAYEGDIAVHTEPKEDDDEASKSTFCVFVACQSEDGTYKIVSANNMGKSYEDNLVRFLGKNMPSDLHTLERGLRNFKKKLALDNSLSSGERKQLERELAAPLKYKPVDVIEMDMPEKDGD